MGGGAITNISSSEDLFLSQPLFTPPSFSKSKPRSKKDHPFQSFLRFFHSQIKSNFKSKSFVLSVALAASLFPFKAYGDPVDIHTGTCADDDSTCSYWGFKTNGDGSFANNTRLDRNPPYTHWNSGGTAGSPLENFVGTIYDMTLKGINLNAPRLNMSGNTDNAKVILDSNVTADLFGTFYTMNVTNSTLNSYISTYAGGKHNQDTFNFDNSTVNGDILNLTNTVSGKVTVNFTNNSVLKGDIIVNSTAISTDASAPATSMWVNFTDSTWYGKYKDINADSRFESHITFTNSQVNPDSDEVTTFSFINGTTYLNLIDSKLNTNVTTQGGMHLDLKNSSVKTINQMGGKNNTINLTNSSAGVVNATGDNATVTLNNSTLGDGSQSIFMSGGSVDLTSTDSTVNGVIYSDAYTSFAINAKNTIFNTKGNENWRGDVLENWYGTLKDGSYFDSSTINGNITWINSSFGSAASEGLAFRNGTVLNGDIVRQDSNWGLDSRGAHFHFQNSTMNGDIIDSTSAQTSADGGSNPISTDRVMFRSSTLNGNVSISSKDLNTNTPRIVDMGLGFWLSNFNFKTITVLSDDSKNKPKLSIALNESTMNGGDIKNQGDLNIKAGRDAHIKGNITTGINDDGTKMSNATFSLTLDTKDRVINDGMADKNTDGTDKVSTSDDPTKTSGYEGRLITSDSGNTITLDGGSMSLLSGSNATATLSASTGTNALLMQDTLLHLKNNSNFTGTLTALGYNRMTLDPNSTLTFTNPSVFHGTLATSSGAGAINIKATTSLFLKPNENSSNLTDVKTPSNTLGFEGTLMDTSSGGNYLEMDSSQAIANENGNTDDMVALVLDKGTSSAQNSFKGTLFTKGNKNYLYLGAYSNFILDSNSFFDGILVATNNSTFNNAKGNVVLENGSDFKGSLSANTLTLKGANITNDKNGVIKAIQVLSGENTLQLSANTTAPILNTGGNVYVSFDPAFDSQTDPISFKGGVYTYGGKTNINFTKTLYVDPNESTILASGNAINNISYNSDMATIGNFSSLLNQIPNKLPVYNIYTQDEAQNNFAISGPFSAKANINYSGGHTTLILADNVSGTLDIKAGADSIATNSLNGFTYKDGISINLDAQKANALLQAYRDLYPTNFASLGIDKLSSVTQAAQEAVCKADSTKCLEEDDPTKVSGFLDSDGTPIYKAYLDGVLVGDISSLETSDSKTKKEYLAVLNPTSAFVGSVEIKDVPISISLSQGAKVIFTKDSTIQTLQSTSNNIDIPSLARDTLSEKNNTIVDLATQANPNNVVRKDDFSTLTINQLDNVSNVVFKFSFGKNASGENDSDRLVVVNNTNSKDNILQIYQNLSHPTELKDGEKVLVASVANGGSIQNGKIFEAGEVVNNEGFDVIKSNIIVLDQDSNDPSNAKPGATYSNYYLSSMSSSINPKAVNLSKAALNSNRSILLSNINDLNKRLGELRDNPYAQGAWARIFNGMTSSDYGIAMTNNFTNVQAGYDYSIGNLQNANQYLGVAVSYGYNSLNASSANLKGSGNMIELGVYYSYVADSGLYTDSILKYAFIGNKLTTNINSSINYNTNALTFGQEVGYRFFLDKNKRFYIDPLAEITLGYFGGGDINQTQGEAFLNSKFDASLLYRVKVGGNMGYRLITSRNETDFRAGLSYLLDGNAGNISMNSNLSSESNQIPISNTGLLQLGVNSIISSNWRAYVDLDVGFGSKVFRQDYLISLGGRYVFGKKTRSTLPINNPSFNKSRK